jgi:hypothetical protein
MTSWLRRLAVAIPVIAASLSILGYLIGWFGGRGLSVSPSSAAEYAAVCTLANAERVKWSHHVVEFRREFEHAPNSTKARDALLYLAESDIQYASALWSALDALTPVQAMKSTQERLLSSWSSSLAILRNYEDHILNAPTTAALVAAAGSLPRARVEQNAILGRALLLRIGGLGCHLDETTVQPVADFPAAVARRLPRRHGYPLDEVSAVVHAPTLASPPALQRIIVPKRDAVAPAVHGPPLLEEGSK